MVIFDKKLFFEFWISRPFKWPGVQSEMPKRLVPVRDVGNPDFEKKKFWNETLYCFRGLPIVFRGLPIILYGLPIVLYGLPFCMVWATLLSTLGYPIVIYGLPFDYT